MAENHPKSVGKWILVPIFALLILALLLAIFAVKGSKRPELIFASENKNTDANQAPADANAQPDQKQKDSKEKKPLPPEHTHPAFSQRVEEREKMVAKQIEARGVRDPNALASLRTVPRHAFVRHSDLRRAYSDQPLPIGRGQTISQPYIVAYMTEALKLKPQHKVLEVGTGSGYQAAVCAEITREVYTIEIIEELAKSAEERLEKLGYRNVFVKAADGYFGWDEKGPFDAIIVTCAAGLVPPPLIEQLKSDGRMILPLGSPYGVQTLVLITKDDQGKIHSRHLMPVRFVPMLGHIEKVKNKRL
jgi:protein-L-isoaspartate(D-aspartate) O-methyltransferase